MQTQLFSWINAYPLYILLAIIVLLLLLVLFGIQHSKKTYIQRKLGMMGVDIIPNARLVDAVGDDLLIDFMVLAPDKVMLVTVLPYEGIIFAAEKIEQWTQVLKNGSFKFANPYQNFAMQKNAAEKAMPNAKIECKLFFPKAKFPRDKPAAILLLEDLPQKKQYKLVDMREVSAAVADQWRTLKGQV